jgi:hypothetical protein
VLGANLGFTGQAPSAGALLKLIASNPYLTETDRARAYAENVITFFRSGVVSELASIPFAGSRLAALALIACVPRKRRAVAAPAVLSAVAWVAIVALNNNASHHQFRYYVPAFLLVLVAASAGAATIAQVLPRKLGHAVAGALVAVIIANGSMRFPAQIDHFRRSSGNIRDQQIELGKRFAKYVGNGDRVLLGDAGAMPFVSDRNAIDALGLGGYRTLPFARAAVNGEAATIELLEHLAPDERPAFMALYPNWFPLLTSRFGTEIDRVTLTDNVICGGPSMVLYRADWSSLGKAPADDELDVADVLSERAHGYTSPAPNGGWTSLDIRRDADGAHRFDAGRTVPAGAHESFIARTEGALRIVVRVDSEARGIRVQTARESVDLTVSPPSSDTWRHASGVVHAHRDETITLSAVNGPYRNYHVWITRLPTP